MGKNLLFLLILFLSCHLIAQDHLEQGRILAREGKFKLAKDFFQKAIEQNEKDAEAWFLLGKTWLVLKDHDEALDCFEEAIDLEEDNAEYHFFRGQALGIKVQHSNPIKKAWLAPKILDEFETTIRLDSTHVGGHVGAANYYLQAPGIIGGSLEKARREAETLLKISPLQGQLLMINVLEKEEKIDEAKQAYAAIDTHRIDSLGYYNFYNRYGYFLMKYREPQKAIQIFKKQVALAPDQANPYDSLGDGYRNAGDEKKAIQAYKKALELNPEFDASRKKLAELQANK